MSSPHIVIIGGGTAGAHLVSRLRRASARITVLEPTGHLQFLTRLAAVAGGAAPVSDAAVRLESLFDVEVLAVPMVSFSERSVDLADGSSIEADIIAVTAGAVPSSPPIEGLDDAFTLRSARDALILRDVIHQTDALTIVGGGPTGAQLAGAVSVARPSVAVTLIESSDRLLPAFSNTLGHRTAQILTSRGVDIRLGALVSRLTATSVELDDGATVAGTPVWAGGFEANMDGHGPTIDGRLELTPEGRVEGFESVFAAGDVAAHTDDAGSLLPMSAQVAVQAAHQIARNIQAICEGRPLKPLSLVDRGWVVDLAGGRGVAELLGVPLAAPLLDRLPPLLHAAIDFRNLWQLGGLDAMIRYRPGVDHQGLDRAELTRFPAALELA